MYCCTLYLRVRMPAANLLIKKFDSFAMQRTLKTITIEIIHKEYGVPSLQDGCKNGTGETGPARSYYSFG